MVNILILMFIAIIINIGVSYLFDFVMRMLNLQVKLPEICKTWNKNYAMEQNLVLNGILIGIASYIYIKINEYMENEN